MEKTQKPHVQVPTVQEAVEIRSGLIGCSKEVGSGCNLIGSKAGSGELSRKVIKGAGLCTW